jgi:hypothetical protein
LIRGGAAPRPRPFSATALRSPPGVPLIDHFLFAFFFFFLFSFFFFLFSCLSIFIFIFILLMFYFLFTDDGILFMMLGSGFSGLVMGLGLRGWGSGVGASLGFGVMNLGLRVDGFASAIHLSNSTARQKILR